MAQIIQFPERFKHSRAVVARIRQATTARLEAELANDNPELLRLEPMKEIAFPE